MKYLLLILGSFLFFTGCSQTKGMKTLSELHQFSGNWTGAGKFYSATNQEGKPWTSTVNYKAVYDDVLVQKKEIIETEGTQSIATLSFLGWDWETNNPVLLSVGNDGRGARKEAMSRISGKKYKVTRTTTNAQGQTVEDEIVTELRGNNYSVVQNRSVNGGTPYISFEGTYQRTKNAKEVDLYRVEAQVPLSEATKRIACMAGIYKQKGHIQNQLLDGDETIELILGGHAMFINFKFKEEAGDGYFGSSLTSWNTDKNRFTGFMVSNDGMTAAFEAWLSDDKTQLIYEPLNSEGEGLVDERWHADLNQDPDHCLEQVLVGETKESSYGLYLKFTKVPAFNPPKNLKIKRTYAMKTSGVKIGKMASVREVDPTKDSILIKDVSENLVGFKEAYDSKTKETFWFNVEGVQDYQGEFTDVKSGAVSNINFKLTGNTVHFESQTPDESKPYKQKFIKGKDFHWSTIYVDPTDRELEQGTEYNRKVLDVSFARTMKLKEKFLRMEKFTLGDQNFDCYVLFIDYGHLKGEIWIAKDELGWFLVYEDAVATEGPFELVLDGYTKTVSTVEE